MIMSHKVFQSNRKQALRSGELDFGTLKIIIISNFIDNNQLESTTSQPNLSITLLGGDLRTGQMIIIVQTTFHPSTTHDGPISNYGFALKLLNCHFIEC